MSGDWVNRMGIILNFCAGFLLAPELIGVQRLQRFEKFLEESILRFRNAISRLALRIRTVLARVLARFPIIAREFVVVYVVIYGLFIALLSVILWGVFLYATLFVFQLSAPEIAVLVICAAAIPFVAICASALMRQNQPLRVIKYISWPILICEFGFLLIPLTISLMILGTASLVGALLLNSVLGIVIARLTGNDRLRGIVVALGIALFIVGNTLQLLATWLQK
jgi:hypothetical protein